MPNTNDDILSYCRLSFLQKPMSHSVITAFPPTRTHLHHMLQTITSLAMEGFYSFPLANHNRPSLFPPPCPPPPPPPLPGGGPGLRGALC